MLAFGQKMTLTLNVDDTKCEHESKRESSLDRISKIINENFMIINILMGRIENNKIDSKKEIILSF